MYQKKQNRIRVAPLPAASRWCITLTRLSTIAALAVCTTACSNQQIYEAVQQSNQFECQKNPKTARERCMEQVSEPYEDYERDRNALLESEAAPHGTVNTTDR